MLPVGERAGVLAHEVPFGDEQGQAGVGARKGGGLQPLEQLAHTCEGGRAHGGVLKALAVDEQHELVGAAHHWTESAEIW